MHDSEGYPPNFFLYRNALYTLISFPALSVFTKKQATLPLPLMNVAFDLRKWSFETTGTGNFPFLPVIRTLTETRTGHGFEIILENPAEGGIQYKSWLPLSLKTALRKHRIEVVINHNHKCSSNISLPQIIFITGDSLKEKSIQKYLRNARLILAPSIALGKEIEERFRIPSNKIKMITPAATSTYTIANDQLKETFKKRVTSGKEFFFCDVHRDDDRVLYLLQAFSQFKKRQKSEMKLLFWKNLSPEVTQKLSKYKYREDVMIIHSETRELLHAAAYCVIHLHEEPFVLPKAMRSASPLIIPSSDTTKEITGGNALFADMNSPTDIAARMMEIYTNENQRTLFINRCLDKSRHYTCEQAADDLWQAITSAHAE